MDEPVECPVVVDGPPILVVPLAGFDRGIVGFKIITGKRAVGVEKSGPTLQAVTGSEMAAANM
jgi:hypothetical protein